MVEIGDKTNSIEDRSSLLDSKAALQKLRELRNKESYTAKGRLGFAKCLNGGEYSQPAKTDPDSPLITTPDELSVKTVSELDRQLLKIHTDTLEQNINTSEASISLIDVGDSPIYANHPHQPSFKVMQIEELNELGPKHSSSKTIKTRNKGPGLFEEKGNRFRKPARDYNVKTTPALKFQSEKIVPEPFVDVENPRVPTWHDSEQESVVSFDTENSNQLDKSRQTNVVYQSKQKAEIGTDASTPNNDQKVWSTFGSERRSKKNLFQSTFDPSTFGKKSESLVRKIGSKFVPARLRTERKSTRSLNYHPLDLGLKDPIDSDQSSSICNDPMDEFDRMSRVDMQREIIKLREIIRSKEAMYSQMIDQTIRIKKENMDLRTTMNYFLQTKF